MRFIYDDNLIPPNSENVKKLYASWQDGRVEVCLTGGRSQGKTVSLWLYLLAMCRYVPGIKIIVGRTDHSLIGPTFLKTLQERVLKYPLGDSTWRHPKNPFYLIGGLNSPKRLVFQNGSEIAFIGLKDPEKVRGMECSIFVLNEGTTEKTQAAWRAIGGSAAGGRGGDWYVHGYPFRQLITDTNPGHPWHWIYQNFHPDASRKAYVPDDKLWLEFTHYDNPALVVPGGKSLNAKGEQTIEDLIRAYGESGFDADRMIWSKWTAAAGLVYSMYSPDRHEINMSFSDFPSDTEWHGYQDHGGGGVRSPFAVGLVGKVGGDFKIYKEIVMSNAIHADVVSAVSAQFQGWGVPVSEIETYVCDDNVPSFNMELRDAGFPVHEADKTDKKAIIDNMKNLIRQGRVSVNKQSLENRCPYYDGPQGLKQEILGYAYLPEEEQRLSSKPDIPVETENHSLDGFGYLVYFHRDRAHIPRDTGLIVSMRRR